MPPLVRWLLLGGALLAFIIVPFVLWETPLARASASLLEAGGGGVVAAAVVALLAADVLLPVPSSVVSTASGALLGFGLGAVANAIGMIAGCIVGYGVGAIARRGGADRVLTAGDRDRAARWTARYGIVALVILRPVPVLAEASVLFAGLTAVPRVRFGVATTLANIGIAVVYAGAGHFTADSGASWLAAGVGAGAIVLPAIAFVVARALRPKALPPDA